MFPGVKRKEKRAQYGGKKQARFTHLEMGKKGHYRLGCRRGRDGYNRGCLADEDAEIRAD